MTYTMMRRVLETGKVSSNPAALLGALAAFLAQPMDCLLLTDPAFAPYGIVGAAVLAPECNIDHCLISCLPCHLFSTLRHEGHMLSIVGHMLSIVGLIGTHLEATL